MRNVGYITTELSLLCKEYKDIAKDAANKGRAERIIEQIQKLVEELAESDRYRFNTDSVFFAGELNHHGQEYETLYPGDEHRDADDDSEESSGGKTRGHGNTKLPYGLCEKYGIEVQKGWTPRDAWAALAGKGVSAAEEYKKLKQSVITQAVTKGIRPDRPMKDSGIEWIGEIPEGWKVSRLKYFSNFINGFAFRSDSFTLDNGCKVIRIGDISQCLDFRGCVRSTISTTTLQPYRINNNDIVIAMSGATTGKCCIAKEVEEAYINQRVGIIRSNNYLHIFYQLQTDYFLEYIKLNNMGSAQPNISSNSIGNFPLLVPPLSEQRAIASYLDEKCAEIDELIAIKQQKVEALKEYKKSVIYEAVTGKFKC